MNPCNNISKCHDLTTISDTDVLRVICKDCHHQYAIRKDMIKGVPEKRQYVKIFRKEALQGNDNLFYKYYPQFICH
jgi:hypothetical protein